MMNRSGSFGSSALFLRRWLTSVRWGRWAAGALAVVILLGLALLVVWDRPPHSWSGKELRYGGDAGGGGPYIFEDQGHLRGFEVDLAQYLADKLDLRSKFVQKDWSMLPQDLKRGDIDLILNGYEWSPEREQEMASTIPYYIYQLQLIARRDDTSLEGWTSLRYKAGQPRKKRVGVLRGSAAHRYLEREYGNDIILEAVGEDGSTGVMLKVNTGGLDATVQDLPAARFYVEKDRTFANLALKGDPIEPGYYVIFVRKNDTELLNQLNEALREAIRDGTLKKIYSSPAYRLWDEEQERLAEVTRNWPPPQLEFVPTGPWDYAPVLLKSAGVTVLLACLSMPLSMLAGMLIAVGRFYGPRWLDWVLGVYVELLRGTPLLLQLFVIYYLLPNVHIDLPAFWAGVLGLAINYSAYEAENYRAGLLAIPRGQLEAALALGMSKGTTLRRIILPQAVRIVIPPVTNDFIALFKDTSVCSVIAVTELTGRYQRLLVDHPRLVLELGSMTALLYLLMSYPLSLAARRLEKRRA
jgi:polar amino acid transport system substrate-binding protein